MPTPLSVIGRALRGRRADESLSMIHLPGLAADAEITIESADFPAGEAMPLATTLFDANQSPALSWSGVPEGTKALVLLLEDIDVPFRTPGIHTVAVLPPEVTEVARGGLAEAADRFVPAMLGKAGYYGPGPVPGHGTHRYRFHLFALDTEVPATLTKARDLPQAIAGHVIARGSITGTYERD